ncbi:unnamed protein product [Arctogadus glacialis]
MDLFDILLRLCFFFLSFILSSETVDSSQDKDVSSDEDETVQPTTEATGKDRHDDTDEDDHETSENISSPPAVSSSNSPLNQDKRGNSKRMWEASEIRAVDRHMMRFINTCKVPRKMDCILCIKAEPNALKKRDWIGLKNYIRNRITSLKRKACAQH